MEKFRHRLKRYKEKVILAMPVRATCDYNRAMTMASVINKNLEKYKGINRGKDVYIVGGGPSVQYFEHTKSKDDVLIGINRTFKDQRFEFDYLFAQDQLPEGFDDFIGYRGKDCTKFLAIIPSNEPIRIKEYKVSGEYERYVLASRRMKSVPIDISIEPFADLCGTVFSAIQFAIYTNPEKIYLVGIDCSQGNIYNKESDDYRYQFEGWRLIREHLIQIGDFSKLASINPVGLKGMFEDIVL